ncbi:MAG TPA: hypothetical protein VN457_04515 [Chlamydiales bacterium]|nr:hypothetical protein [Chlamydiales bacterium]
MSSSISKEDIHAKFFVAFAFALEANSELLEESVELKKKHDTSDVEGQTAIRVLSAHERIALFVAVVRAELIKIRNGTRAGDRDKAKKWFDAIETAAGQMQGALQKHAVVSVKATVAKK